MLRPSCWLLLLRQDRTRPRARGATPRLPRPRERPGALHPQVQVVLEGVADGAVALERRAGASVAASEAKALRHRHVERPRPVVRAPGDAVRGAVHDRAGHLEGQQRVREVMLDRLEAARWASRTARAPSRTRPSCRACAGRGRGAARRCASGAPVPGARRGRAHRSRRSVAAAGSATSTSEEPPRPVDRTRCDGASPRSARRRGARRAMSSGGAGRTSRRTPRRAPARSPTLTRTPRPLATARSQCACAAPRVAEQRHRHRRRLDHGSGQRDPSRLLEDSTSVELVESRARPEPRARGGPTRPSRASFSTGPATRAVGCAPRGAHRLRRALAA